MRIAMIGTGYVGLVSGACLSEFGHDVVCIDKDKAKIEALRAGKIPIFEPGLDEVVAANVKAGRLSFDTGLERAVGAADAVFIAVGTPGEGTSLYRMLLSFRGDHIGRNGGGTGPLRTGT